MRVKKIAKINRTNSLHWVGDGFPVSTLFSYHEEGNTISPFLLLDYAEPAIFEPSDHPKGVGQHPHRGFETVTIVYQGEVEHKDSAGHMGKVGPGDVQWMTAARGILHEEMHGRDFTRKGGTLEMIQLWVNLPAKDKMTSPRYQEILSKDIPVVKLGDDGSLIRVIAGEYAGTKGAAETFTPVNVWDVRMHEGYKIALPLQAGFTTSLLVLQGSLLINGAETIQTKELTLFEREGDVVSLEAKKNSVVLVLSGAPIDEPIAGHGPFVMNTREEIDQAMADYRAGRF